MWDLLATGIVAGRMISTPRLGLLFCFAAGCIPVIDGSAPGVHVAPRPSRGNPLAAVRFHVDPRSSAKKQAEEWRASRPADAAAIERIASQPQAEWMGEWSGTIEAAVDERVAEADRAHEAALFVAYDIPSRDCGQHSAGGLASAASYREWIRGFARGLRGRRATVILEPDALALLDKCLSAEMQAERFALLSDAVGVLGADATTTIHLDAGHARWVPAATMAARLRAAGVDGADGFALNVSNYIGTADSIAYGKDISAQLGGKHFVIDTSRNGNGPTSDLQWCNPPGRAIGLAPTTRTGEPLLDAYLWIKRPGESDGACNGGPRAGEWWPERGLELARAGGK